MKAILTLLILATGMLTAATSFADPDAPYGTSKFESYRDIGTIDQLKTCMGFQLC